MVYAEVVIFGFRAVLTMVSGFYCLDTLVLTDIVFQLGSPVHCTPDQLRDIHRERLVILNMYIKT